MKDRPRSTSLRSQILSRTLIVGLVPLASLAFVAVLGLHALNMTADRQVAESREADLGDTMLAQLSTEAASTGREIDLVLGRNLNRLASLATEATIVAGASQGAPIGAPALAEGQRNAPTLTAVAYTDRNGRVVADTGSGTGRELGDTALWQLAWTNGAGVGPVVANSENVAPVIPIAVRIDDAQGVPVGVLISSLDSAEVRAVADYRIESGVDITVLTTDGLLLAETESGHAAERIGNPGLSDASLSPGVQRALDTIDGAVITIDGAYGFKPVVLDAALAVGGSNEQASGLLVVTGQRAGGTGHLLAGLEELDRKIDAASRQLLAVVLIVVVFAAFVAITIATMLTREIVGPVDALTARARHVAEHALPSAVQDLLEGNGDSGSPQDIAIEIEADNELRDLVQSFNSVHGTAITLATEQARQRRNTLQMFTNLGRRNQSLLKRQLRLIDELERSEEDGERLGSLFSLDHLATRMRRNAESLLVIAGDRAPIGRADSAHMELVVHAALGEVEHYERVTTATIDPAVVVGRVVSDVAHILAELIENSLTFSPPDSVVWVGGIGGAEHYTVLVRDHGLGLSEDQMVEFNDRLAEGFDVQMAPSTQLGLLVVSKLAARHGILVRLGVTSDGGTEATIKIPNHLVESATGAQIPEPQDHRTETELEPVGAVAASTTAGVPTSTGVLVAEAMPMVETESDNADQSLQPVAGNEGRRAEDQTGGVTDESVVGAPTGLSMAAAVADRYLGDLSPASSARVTTVVRRESRRSTSAGINRRTSFADRKKRAVATQSSPEVVAAEADELKQRWTSFRRGQDQARPTTDAPEQPAAAEQPSKGTTNDG